MNQEQVSPEQTIETLEELQEDPNIPKNIKEKIQSIIATLKEDSDTSIKVNKALSDLDEISNDPNLDQMTRTQIWNVVSTLETISH